MRENQNRDEEAARWTARRLSGEMSPEETAGFEAWLADPENRAAFEACAAAAASLDAHAASLLAASFEEELHAEQAARESRRRSWTAGALAASLAAVAAAGLIAAFVIGGRDAVARYATARGETLRVSLADESLVTLNTASRIEVAYSKRARRINLVEGEALFDVRRDPEKPFLVATRHGEVSVTGTVFAVRSDDAQTDVFVVSGAVSVAPPANGAVMVLAGQRVAMDGSGRSSAVEAFDPNLALAWREGKARFRNAPLGEAIAELNRYFERPLTLGDPSLADRPVTGEFDIRDQQTAINALVVAFDLEPHAENGSIVLEPASR
ncbi:FecR family protein [Amphiplicatus metriothermophilus]|uniref:FecR family protein n=2 Tax=Amphiplicatus metriothermophilus TaxID=1519374 RepID=A0A239PTR7_9PROT|nr:FecR family protein [Amphiplicatus metriothermophilus]